jgi:hypothetical protein
MRHRLAAALGLAALLLLGRGEVALANANAYWNPAFNDPARVDISDISGLAKQTSLYTDPMDAVRRALLVVLGPTGLVAPATAATPHETVLSAHHPRAPPAV